ncbi:MAG: metallophosphoesterase family protein [Gammaproteobacteria bacterium]|nr:metallophosphoesterase family protein [Gammaproteobacteria bacterium]
MRQLGEIHNRLLIFGGPYSNLAATRAMYEKAQQLQIAASQVICTGDLVAYCAEPQQTVDLIRDWGIAVVMGNCEESLGSNQVDCGCGFKEGSTCSSLSIAWYEYANQRINLDSRLWMMELPRFIDFSIRGYRFKVVHGSVSSNSQFVFPSTSAQLKEQQITDAGTEVVIGGHSGIPFGQKLGSKLWLNAGVIGLPANDGSSDGWYMLLDQDEGGFAASWHRLSYDAATSQRSTRAAGMSEYALALGTGLWPSMEVLPPLEQGQQGKRLELGPVRVDVHHA